MSTIVKCKCDFLGASMHGAPLCDEVYTEEEDMEVLRNMLSDSGLHVNRRQKHAIANIIEQVKRLKRTA